MKDFAAIVLAAGKGTRMKSKVAKVLHPVCGRPMLFYPLRVLKDLKASNITVVVGHGAEPVKEIFGSRGVSFCVQDPQLGTGHAVMCAAETLRGFKGDLLIISGDTPLITKQTVKGLFSIHRTGGKAKPVLSFVTALLDDPAGYGRVVRDEGRAVVRVVEDRDAAPGEKLINEINAGMYLIDSEFLFENMKRLSTRNVQKEYYLPDLIPVANKKGGKVSALTLLDPEEVMGVNNRCELARAGRTMRMRIMRVLMDRGVTIIDPENTYIDFGVKIGRDTTVYPGAHLLGDTVIGEDCTVEEGVRISDSVIGGGTVIKGHSVIEDSKIGKNASIGPFARFRPGNDIKDRVRIGNFVEVKNSRISSGSKANHLTYIGDSDIGKDVNIGAGTITCNYDGVKKHRTIIEDGVFIGSDTQLVAPVRVKKNAYIGSGSTITRDVPGGALALTRAEQKVIKGWVKKKGLLKKRK